MLPVNAAPIVTDEDGLLVALARDIASDLVELPDILRSYGVTPDQFERIRHLPRFIDLLEQHQLEWSKPTNTHERTKLKAAILIEDWLPEAHRQLHTKTEPLNARVALGQLIARLAGMGERENTAPSGEKITVTINLGGDTQLKLEHAKVIDAEPAT